MKKSLRIIFGVLGFVWFITLLVVGFLAYFVSSAKNGVPVDGLGRQISEAPFLMRFMFGQEKMWAGWMWFFIDMVAFWGSVAIVVHIGRWLEDKK